MLPIGTGLLEVDDAVVLEPEADLDRLGGRVGAVGVDQKTRLVAERAPDLGNDLIGPPRPLVLVVTALLADPELEGSVPIVVLQARQARGLGVRRDLAALHA